MIAALLSLLAVASAQNTWTTHEETVHGIAVPIAMFLGMVVVFALVSMVSSKQAATNDTVDAGSIPAMLSGLGLITVLFSIFLLFTVNWNFAIGWLFFGVASFGAAQSKAFPAALLAGVLNTIGFIQNSGTVFVISGPTFAAMLDQFDVTECKEYFQEQDGTIDRCKDDQYLQLARVSSLLIMLFQFLQAYLAFQLAGAAVKAVRA